MVLLERYLSGTCAIAQVNCAVRMVLLILAEQFVLAKPEGRFGQLYCFVIGLKDLVVLERSIA